MGLQDLNGGAVFDADDAAIDYFGGGYVSPAGLWDSRLRRTIGMNTMVGSGKTLPPLRFARTDFPGAAMAARAASMP